MRYTIADLVRALDEIAPFDTQEAWDNSGLMVGNIHDEVCGIYLSLDVTKNTVRNAIQKKCNVIVAHHPILFSPLQKLDYSDPTAAVLRDAIRAEIAVIAAHTNLDKAECGVNDALAKRLGLIEVNKNTEEPIGCIAYAEPRTCGEWVQTVRAKLHSRGIRTVGDQSRTVTRIGLCGGAGGSLLETGFVDSIDLLITSEVKHHQALHAKAKGVFVIDAGHYETEYPVLSLLREMLSEKIQVPYETEPFEPPFNSTEESICE